MERINEEHRAKSIDDYEPRHCPSHEENSDLVRSLKTRMNIIIGGIGTTLAVIAWVCATLYSMNGVVAGNASRLTAVENATARVLSDVTVLQSQQKSNDEWHRMWELKDQFDHRSRKEGHTP